MGKVPKRLETGMDPAVQAPRWVKMEEKEEGGKESRNSLLERLEIGKRTKKWLMFWNVLFSNEWL